VTAALTLLATSFAIVLLLLALFTDRETSSAVSQRRAKKLFLSKLSAAERRWWSRHRRLTIVGSSGRRYILTPYEPFNIRAGNEAYCLCVRGRIPVYDKLLAQRLLVESDEPRFLAIANRRELRI
jgi:hypothetical protein